MLDWEAPTGGYLLTACFASGYAPAWRPASWLARQRDERFRLCGPPPCPISVCRPCLHGLESGCCPWQAPRRDRHRKARELQLFVENDMLARTDRYYTNGIKLGGGVPFDLLQLPATEVLRQLAPEGKRDHPPRPLPWPEPIHAEVDQHQPGPALRSSLGRLALSWRRGATGQGEPTRHGGNRLRTGRARRPWARKSRPAGTS
jgi:hypothetical protein